MSLKEPPVYSVEFVNRSRIAGDACLFQILRRPPCKSVSLVWLAKAAAPTTRVLFTWRETLSFFWRERDPHVTRPAKITSSQLWPADEEAIHRVTLSRGRRGAYSFREVVLEPGERKLIITQDRTVAPNVAEVGLAMGGFPAHVVPAQPNLTTIFRPAVTYGIAFGTFAHGDAVDVTTIAGAPQFLFPKNVRTMTATLHRDNTWDVKATPRRRSATAHTKNR